MVQHIVLWTYRDGVDKDAEFAAQKKGFDAWVADVPGMVQFSLNRGFDGFDVCLISLHEDRAALEVYQNFPAHVEMKEIIAKTRAQRAACDFETG